MLRFAHGEMRHMRGLFGEQGDVRMSCDTSGSGEFENGTSFHDEISGWKGSRQMHELW
jgi:hypothetical protein